MMPEVSMVILAGGKSSRMGRDKADLLLGEKTFLEIQIEKGRTLGIEDILVSGYRGERCPVPVVKDRFVEKGPLGGLEACFRQVKNPYVLVLCVDVPLVPVEELRVMMDMAQAKNTSVILRHGDRTEPMMGVFCADLADDMVEEIRQGRGRMFHVLMKRGHVVYESEMADELFRNVNDPEEYARLQSGGKSVTGEAKAVQIFADGTRKNITRGILKEQVLQFWVNGTWRSEMTGTGQHLEELVLGHLLTEGLIHGAEDVVSLSFRKEDTEVHVRVQEHMQKGSASEDCSQEVQAPEETEKACFGWKPEWIWKLADAYEKGLELREKTRSTHLAFLMKEGEILFACEDIGRHNAVDKAIGYALKKGIDLRQSVLFTSGRMPSDMVEKAAAAGVPMLVSGKLPTEEGIALAKKAGVILIGNARHDNMLLFAEKA